MKRITFYLIVLTLIISCNKEDLKWNLDKVGRLPTITTGIISNITNISASASAEITNDGGAKITARGVCWSTAPTPLLTGSHTTDSVGIGTFTSYITGLNAGTTYYIRAYATNSVGTAYGNQISFTTTNISASLPTLSTTSPNSITNSTAVSGGNISSDGGSNVTQRGVCWSSTQNPSISNNITNSGTGIGSFTSSLTGLTANTTYYVKAYATNGVGTAYGNQLSFTTTTPSVSLATLTTMSVTSITTTSSTNGGNISNDGGSAVTSRGVCWGTTANPTIANSFTSNGTGIGTFTSSITGLTPATTYYVRAYATNSVGTAYGNQVSFTTASPSVSLATLTTTSVTSITTTSSTSGGNISNDGGAAVTSRGVCWGTTANPTIANSFTNNGTGIGTFTSSITGLTPATTYYVRAYATNSVGTAYGNQVSFITTAPSASLISTNNCNSLNGITSLYSGMNSTSAVWGMSSSGYSGSCWVAPDPLNSGNLGTAVGTHFVQFSHTFSNNGYIEFWLNTYNPSYNNVFPTIFIDGIPQATPMMIGGNPSSFYFMKVQSSNISAGVHTIKIQFVGSYYIFKIDEIDFYEY
jgi:hypothetical protein